MLIQKCLGLTKGFGEPFKCRDCQKAKDTSKAFHNHLNQCKSRKKAPKQTQEAAENSESEARFNCLECEAVLTSNEAFASHMSQHEEDMEDVEEMDTDDFEPVLVMNLDTE